jgi:hypothetical protein
MDKTKHHAEDGAMADVRIRDLERRVADGDADAMRELMAELLRMGKAAEARALALARLERELKRRGAWCIRSSPSLVQNGETDLMWLGLRCDVTPPGSRPLLPLPDGIDRFLNHLRIDADGRITESLNGDPLSALGLPNVEIETPAPGAGGRSRRRRRASSNGPALPPTT